MLPVSQVNGFDPELRRQNCQRRLTELWLIL